MVEVSEFSTSAGGNNAAAPNGAPEGMLAGSVNNTIREIMAAIARQHAQAEWIGFDEAAAYEDTDSFSFTGADKTDVYHVGRRVRLQDNTTAYVYGTITSSTFSTDTTIVLSMDSGNVPNPIAKVEVGIISKVDGSLPSLADIFAPKFEIVDKDANFTIDATHNGKIILCDAESAAFTATLTAAATLESGFVVTLLKTDIEPNAVTIDGASSETINGQLTYLLRSQFDAVTIACDGTGFYTISEFKGGKFIRQTTGTTESLVAADNKNVVTFNNSSPVAVSIAEAGTAGFGSGYSTIVKNIGAGKVTITPTDCDIDGAATFELTTGQSATIFSDGTDYVTAGKNFLNPFQNVIQVRHQVTSGTDGGTASTGSYTTRVLNTEVKNTISGASLASNQVTLPAGEYFVQGYANIVLMENVKHRLRDVTNGADLVIGVSDNAADVTGTGSGLSNSGHNSQLQGFFTLAGETDIELQYYAGFNTGGAQSLGRATGSGIDEVYSDLTFLKIA